MATRVTFAPGLSRFVRFVVIAIAVAILASLVLRFGRRGATQTSLSTGDPAPASIAHALIPTIALCVSDGANEATWVDSLLPVIGGQKELVVPNGRVDVVTEDFAIEVDFIRKWHEGIGQALHYASATGKRPALALIVPHSEWPLRSDRLSLLQEIDAISSKQQIKVVVLRPGCL